MFKLVSAAVFAAITLLPATAYADRTPLEQSVARELPRYGFKDVDVDQLSSSQVAALYMLVHGKRSHGDKRALIKSTLGGRNTLRGLLFD